MNENKIILILAGIFIVGAPFYALGYIQLQDFSIFGFSLGALFISVSSLLDNPLKKDGEQHVLRKITKNVFFIFGFILIIISPLLNTNIPFLENIINSIDSNVFLLYSIGFSFLTLFISDIYKKQFHKKIENEKNKAVAKTLNKYNEEITRKFNTKRD